MAETRSLEMHARGHASSHGHLKVGAHYGDIHSAGGSHDGGTPHHVRSGYDRSADLILPLEDRVIGRDNMNDAMLRKCFGGAAFAAMRNRSVVCSGVLLGSPVAFAALRSIATLVRRCPLDKMSDQSSLIYWAYVLAHRREHSAKPQSGLPALPLRIELQPRGRGFTNTVGIFKSAPWDRPWDRTPTQRFIRAHMRDGVVMNDDGTPAPVVHQCTRA